jgi:hypothetical protein
MSFWVRATGGASIQLFSPFENRPEVAINEAEHVAHATLTAVMGRTAAYTGQEVTWDAMMDSKEHLGPTEYAMGPVPIKAVVPVPGNGENTGKHMRS